MTCLVRTDIMYTERISAADGGIPDFFTHGITDRISKGGNNYRKDVKKRKKHGTNQGKEEFGMIEFTDDRGKVVGTGDQTTGTVEHRQGSRGMSVRLRNGQSAVLIREGTVTYVTWYGGAFMIERCRDRLTD